VYLEYQILSGHDGHDLVTILEVTLLSSACIYLSHQRTSANPVPSIYIISHWLLQQFIALVTVDFDIRLAA